LARDKKKNRFASVTVPPSPANGTMGSEK